MKYKLFFGFLFWILFLIIFIHSETLFSGTCRDITFPNPDPVNYTVEGNSSDMDGFSYEKNGTTITYCFHPLYKPDNFTITFYNYQEVDIGNGGSNSESKGSPGSAYVWKGATPKKKDVNKTEVNITEVDEPDIITEPDEVVDKKIPKWMWIVVGVLFLIVGIGIKIYFKKGTEETGTVVELPNNYNND